MNALAIEALPVVVSVPAVMPLPIWMVPLKALPSPSVPTVPGPLSRPPMPRIVWVAVAPFSDRMPPWLSTMDSVPVRLLLAAVLSWRRSSVRKLLPVSMSPFQFSCSVPVAPRSTRLAPRFSVCEAAVVIELPIVRFDGLSTAMPSLPMPFTVSSRTRAPSSCSWPV